MLALQHTMQYIILSHLPSKSKDKFNAQFTFKKTKTQRGYVILMRSVAKLVKSFQI